MFDTDGLRRMVAGFNPEDAGEAAARASILALIDGVVAPAARSTFEPGHLTASAVLRNRAAGTILLVHHAKLGRWLQPGGHIERHDATALAAARREAIEEAGDLQLDARGLLDLDVHAIPPWGDEPAHRHFDLRFLFDVRGGVARPGGEVRDVRWVGTDDLSGLDVDASVVRLIDKAVG